MLSLESEDATEAFGRARAEGRKAVDTPTNESKKSASISTEEYEVAAE